MQINLITVAKNVGTVLGTVMVIYGVMWGAGIAPISNGQAEDMIRQEMDVRIQGVESSVEDLNDEIDEIKIQTERIDERTERTIDIQNDILQELRAISRGLSARGLRDAD